jgi:hypothetical protein
VTHPDADPPPERFLARDQNRLRSLVTETRQAVNAGETEGAPLRTLQDALRLHVRIEEQLCFPTLLSLHSALSEEVVRRARREQSDLLKSVDELSGAPMQDRKTLANEMEHRAQAYLIFEEQQLLPLFSALPRVTLREMSLEMQEMAGGRPHEN